MDALRCVMDLLRCELMMWYGCVKDVTMDVLRCAKDMLWCVKDVV